MKTFYLICAIFLFHNNSTAQTFETIIPAPLLIPPCADSNNSYGLDIAQLNNDHVVLSRVHFGSSDCPITLGTAYALTRVSEIGDTLFNTYVYHPNQQINSSGGYRGIALDVSEDSSIYVTGEEVMSGQPDQIFLSKHSSNGTLLWKMNYGNSNILRPFELLVDSSNVYIGGHSYLPNQGEQPGVMKINSSGILQWVEYADTTAFTNVNNIVKRTTDYVLVGSQISQNSGSNDYRIFSVPFTSSGLDSTVHFYGNPANNYGHTDAIYNLDNELTIAAYSSFDQDVLFLEIDDNNIVLDQFVMQPNISLDYYRMSNFVQLTDSNYALVGQTGYFSLPNFIFSRSINIIKLNQAGFVLWMKEYAGNAAESLSTNSNGVIVVGHRFNQDISILGYYSSLVMQIDSTGNTGNCIPQFISNSFDSDTMYVGGMIHLHNNSFGEADNFQWTVNGNTSSQLFDFSDTYTIMDTGWHVISLIGCGTSFTDSIYAVIPPSAEIDNLITSNSFDYKMYPNPSHGKFTIAFQNFAEDTELEVLDLSGRIIFSTQIIAHKTTLNLTQSPGIYYVRVKSGGLANVKKIRVE